MATEVDTRLLLVTNVAVLGAVMKTNYFDHSNRPRFMTNIHFSQAAAVSYWWCLNFGGKTKTENETKTEKTKKYKNVDSKPRNRYCRL